MEEIQRKKSRYEHTTARELQQDLVLVGWSRGALQEHSHGSGSVHLGTYGVAPRTGVDVVPLLTAGYKVERRLWSPVKIL